MNFFDVNIFLSAVLLILIECVEGPALVIDKVLVCDGKGKMSVLLHFIDIFITQEYKAI